MEIDSVDFNFQHQKAKFTPFETLFEDYPENKIWLQPVRDILGLTHLETIGNLSLEDLKRNNLDLFYHPLKNLAWDYLKKHPENEELFLYLLENQEPSSPQHGYSIQYGVRWIYNKGDILPFILIKIEYI